MSFEFQDSPPKADRITRTHWRMFSVEAKKNPGRWAVVARYKNSKAAQTKASALNYRPPLSMQPVGSFESVARGTEVYSRYIGEEYLNG